MSQKTFNYACLNLFSTGIVEADGGWNIAPHKLTASVLHLPKCPKTKRWANHSIAESTVGHNQQFYGHFHLSCLAFFKCVCLHVQFSKTLMDKATYERSLVANAKEFPSVEVDDTWAQPPALQFSSDEIDS